MKNISWSHRVSWQLLNLVPVDAGAGLGDELVEERAEAVQVRHPPPPVQYSTVQYSTVQYIPSLLLQQLLQAVTVMAHSQTSVQSQSHLQYIHSPLTVILSILSSK